MSLLEQIPPEPLVCRGAVSKLLHRVRPIGDDVIELWPASFGLLIMGWTFLALSVVVPPVLWFGTSVNHTIALLPMSLAFCCIGIFGGVFIIRRFGTRVLFDRHDGLITATGMRFLTPLTIELPSVMAVQLCLNTQPEPGIRAIGWHFYQLILVIDEDPIRRIGLLECGGFKKMHLLAEEIACFLDVPVVENV